MSFSDCRVISVTFVQVVSSDWVSSTRIVVNPNGTVRVSSKTHGKSEERRWNLRLTVGVVSFGLGIGLDDLVVPRSRGHSISGRKDREGYLSSLNDEGIPEKRITHQEKWPTPSPSPDTGIWGGVRGRVNHEVFHSRKGVRGGRIGLSSEWPRLPQIHQDDNPLERVYQKKTLKKLWQKWRSSNRKPCQVGKSVFVQ